MQNNTPFGPAAPLPYFVGNSLFPPKVLGVHMPGENLPAHIKAILAKEPADFKPSLTASTTGLSITHAALILDSSGSMTPHRETVVAGYNSQITVIAEGAELVGTTLVTVNVFNSLPNRILSAAPVEKLTPMAIADYVTAGGTALYDALGETIAFLLEQPGAEEPNTAFLVAAFTDGDELSSRTYNSSILKELICRLEATGRWTFTLMGPTGGATEMASMLNIPTGNVATFNPHAAASVNSAFDSMLCASRSYMTARSEGATASACLYAGIPPAHG